jgi:hypothetical protein
MEGRNEWDEARANCLFTCAGEEMCKRKFRNGVNWLEPPESKSSRASKLNFERLANLRNISPNNDAIVVSFYDESTKEELYDEKT